MTIVTDYLALIEATSTVRERVERARIFYSHLFGNEEPSHIFLSESIDGQGQKIYENLHLVYSKAWCEAHFFLLKEEYDVCTLKSITRTLFTSENLDNPETPSMGSKLQIDITFASSVIGKLLATGINCQPLWKLGREIFVPRVKEL